MLHHLSLPVADLARARAVYDPALAALGYGCVFADATFVGYGETGGDDQFALALRQPALAAGPGFHLAFRAPSRGAVDRFHAAALQGGARDNGAPGLRPAYGPTYYAAFIIDADGHRIEAVHT
ncbi:MAG: VOC family protein [Pseudomonadota bacterium]